MSEHRSVVPPSPLPLQLRNRSAEWLNFALCIVFVAGYVAAGLILAIGPDRLHQSNSMRLVEGLGLPWPLWGVVYIVVGALLCHHSTRVAGYFTGATLAAFYLTSYIVSIRAGNPGSAPGVFAGYVTVFSQLSGGIRSMIIADWRRA